MKKLIVICAIVVMASCTKSTNEPTQRSAEPTAEITNTVRVFSGSNPSVKISYTLANTSLVKEIRLNNILNVVVKDGPGIMYDHQAGGNWFATYWFVFNKKDGTQISTPAKIHYF